VSRPAAQCKSVKQDSNRPKLLPILEQMDVQTVALESGLALDKRQVVLHRNARLASNRLSLQQHQPMMVVQIVALVNGLELVIR